MEGKGLTYYLDISKDEIIDKRKLAEIIKIIFGKKLNEDNEYDIKEFCNEIAFDTVGLFDSKHIFSKPEYEDDIGDAFFEAPFTSYKLTRTFPPITIPTESLQVIGMIRAAVGKGHLMVDL